jgi:hypothetical protein
MRPYFLVAPTLWTGTTGKDWKALGSDYQVLGVYLQTGPAANQYGLYYVSRAQMIDETGVQLPTMKKVLAHFADTKYAFYDQEAQWCWVTTMARRQLLTNGSALTPGDRRAIGAAHWYKSLPDNPFLAPFFDTYHALLHLEQRRTATCAAVPLDLPFALAAPGTAIAVRAVTLDDLFERWWKHYPKPAGKRAARAEWAKLKPPPTEAAVDQWIQALERQRRSTQWLKDNGDYIPDPERYIKKGRMFDEETLLPSLTESDARTISALDSWTPPK